MIAPYVRKAYPGLSIQTDVSVIDRTVIITNGIKPSRPSHLAPEGTIINGLYLAIIACAMLYAVATILDLIKVLCNVDTAHVVRSHTGTCLPIDELLAIVVTI